METFLRRFGDQIIGVLHGFDRLRFRGSKRTLCYPAGLLGFLWQMQVLLKDFGRYTADLTSKLCQAVEATARAQGIPTIYLASSNASKEDTALANAAARGLTTGPIAVLSCIEQCRSWEMRRNLKTHRFDPIWRERKCLHYYHYYLDGQYGLTYTRLQSWFPFTINVGLNGREWLAQQLQGAGINYQKRDNCFTQVEDWAAAQRLLDDQVRQDWPTLLETLAARSNPLHAQLPDGDRPYYWSVEQSEWASDVRFAPAALARWFPTFVRHGTETLHCTDVLRFLGYKVPAYGPHHQFQGEVLIDRHEREEGTRLKYVVKNNGTKMYDKHGNLRLETTLVNVSEFPTYRTSETDPEGKRAWRPMRKGVADLPHRAEVSQRVNERQAESLATVAAPDPLGNLTKRLCRPVLWHGRKARAMNPLATADRTLLEAVSRGEFLLQGFRNRDLRPLLFGAKKVPPEEHRRQAAAVTRQLRLLRAHGLIRKVPKTHRYHLSTKGQTVITAVLAAQRADTATLINAVTTAA